MALITLKNVTVAFGADPVLDAVDLQIDAGERVCLIGRNGGGKSTLMGVLHGDLQPESGEIVRRDGLRVAQLEQTVPGGLAGDVFDVVAAGLGREGELLQRYHHLSQDLARDPSDALMQKLAAVQHELEALGAWEANQRVETVVSRLSLPGDAAFEKLSGGLKRRVMLARALVTAPDILLLDEPTNHLDIDSIQWLEAFLLDYGGTLVFVTHDRAFLERLATRIVELDRGRLTSWPGDFSRYQAGKAAQLEAEAAQQREFDKKLAQEERWIRQGIKARRTRNEGRVRALERMREERRRRRERVGDVKLMVQEAERSGQLVVEAEGIGYEVEGRALFRDFSTTILRGDRIGVIGSNGSGKTTLLKVLLGELAPQDGRVRHGTNLEVAYFDQLRGALDPEQSVLDNVGEGRDRLTIDGQSRHLIGYLQDFLFSPERARTPVKALSGGECSRVLLAKLFARPSNVLVMDEPTNDLDMETLELLEERLAGYGGTLLLVSHDRRFLDNVVTSTIVFEGDGRVAEYVGGYEDWLRQRPAERPATSAPPEPKPAAGRKPPKRQRKLGYREKRELEELPARIEQLEAELEGVRAQMAAPEFYREQDKAAIAAAQRRLAELEEELAGAYERWEALEGLED